ncbi:MAG: putative Glu-tRNA amidotransferase [Tardiphaga sp.]|nr:putative Glu-tRNA amidotransferase [Tardiphaga sp.]MDB5546830.1 putative Glu-tRNA amidotransferase [Tardiphaga sp.]
MLMTDHPTLASLAADLAAGKTTSRALVERCLANIADPKGEGARVFVHVDRDGALAAADAMDALRKANAAPSPFAGIPVSIKDLFDIKGQVTKAGSRALDDMPPAEADAPAVARLRRAGFVVIGRTNMTEFAYSGLGINPHYDTPKGVWRRDVGQGTGHVPGGSSSGGAVSIVDGMAFGALGTDTGGSCRIPAAFNGIVGFKPTAERVPLDGAIPLSQSLDSIGPLARTVSCCAIMDAVLADDDIMPLAPRPVHGLRLLVPTTIVLDDLDAHVSKAFELALQRLEAVGAIITRAAFPEFNDVGIIGAKGGFPAAESYAWHRRLMERRGGDYDPRVISRIMRGESHSAADYLDMLAARDSLIARAALRLEPYDALLMPTAAQAPPAIAAMTDEAAYTKANLAALRNSTFINMIDGCAISLPISRPGDAPVGLTLAAAGWHDREIFDIAAGIEDVVRG